MGTPITNRLSLPTVNELPFLIAILLPFFNFSAYSHGFEIYQWDLLYSASVISGLLCLKNGWTVIHLPRPILLVGLASLLGIIANYQIQNISFFSEYTLRVLSFSLLSFFGFHFFRSRKLSFSTVAFAWVIYFILVLLHWWDYWDSPPFSSTDDLKAISGPWGNINIAGQYLCMTGGTLLLFIRRMRKWQIGLWILPIVGAFAFLWVAQNRSSLLGVALGLVAGLLFFIIKKWGKKKLAPAFILLFALSTLAVVSINCYPEILKIKPTSTSHRMELAKQTLKLIGETPLGVGFDRFDHAIVPYSRLGKYHDPSDSLARTPHNEFFRIVAEEGWFVGGLIFLFFIIVAYSGLRTFANINILFVPLLCIWITEILFQFPLKIPFPFFQFSLFIGLIFPTDAKPTERRAGKMTLMAFMITILCVHFSQIYSRYIFPTSPMQACLWNPENWAYCDIALRIAEEKEDFRYVENQAIQELKKKPTNLLAMRHLILLQINNSNKAVYCEGIALYKYLDSEPKEFNQLFKKDCSQSQPLDHSDFKTRSLNWLR